MITYSIFGNKYNLIEKDLFTKASCTVLNHYKEKFSNVKTKIYLNKHTNSNIYMDCNNKFDKKFITLIMCLKNRSNRALLSIQSIVNKQNSEFANFIIVEDTSENNLDLSNTEYSNYINHYIINTGLEWSRSLLLNFGIIRAKTPLILAWDADFIFNDDFLIKLYDYANKVNFDKHYLGISLWETHDYNLDDKKKRRYHGDPYSAVYIYKRIKLIKLRGFDEELINHGYEERDLHSRLLKYYGIIPLYNFYINTIFVLHYTHEDTIRGKLDTLKNKKISDNKIKNGILIRNTKKWGDNL